MKPTAEMAKVARRALTWRKEYGRGGTQIGVARARDIANRKNLSEETIKRMRSYFARHEVDKKAEGFKKGEKGFPSAGRIAWDLWGGDIGQTWVNKMATKKQLANLKKARAVLAKKRAAGTVKKRRKANPPKKRKVTTKKKAARRSPTAKARRVLRTGQNTGPKVKQEHVITVNGRYFEGAGFTSDLKKAARYQSLSQAKLIAQRVADVTKKTTAIKLVKG